MSTKKTLTNTTAKDMMHLSRAVYINMIAQHVQTRDDLQTYKHELERMQRQHKGCVNGDEYKLLQQDLEALQERHSRLGVEHAKEVHKAEMRGRVYVLRQINQAMQENSGVDVRYTNLYKDMISGAQFRNFVTGTEGLAYVQDLIKLEQDRKWTPKGKTDTVYPTPLNMANFELLLSCCDEATLRKFALKLVS